LKNSLGKRRVRGCTVNSSGGGGQLSALSLPKSFVATALTVPVTDPSTPVTAIEFTAANLTGVMTSNATAGDLHGPMGIAGQARICVPFIFPCLINLTMPLTSMGTRGVGLGGTITATDALIGDFTLSGGEWTVGTAAITGAPTINGGTTTTSAAGFVHGPLSGSASSAARLGGSLQMVSPRC
jgi:hypothetical protein